MLLRERGLEDAAFLGLAREVHARLAACTGGAPATPSEPPSELAAPVWLGLHDRAHLLEAANADGLHLGFRSLPAERVPAPWIAGRALGLSTHAGDRVDPASPATYVVHGPLHATPSKQGLLEPLGYSALAEFCAGCPVPVWAIGGVAPEHAREALESGAAGVAVLRGILGADDPQRAAANYMDALGKAS